MATESSLGHSYALPKSTDRGQGPGAAGQSGDTQGLPEDSVSGGESITELVEEGQAFEADVLMGVEDALEEESKPGRKRGVHTHQVPEDDVPAEYQDRDA